MTSRRMINKKLERIPPRYQWCVINDFLFYKSDQIMLGTEMELAFCAMFHSSPKLWLPKISHFERSDIVRALVF